MNQKVKLPEGLDIDIEIETELPYRVEMIGEEHELYERYSSEAVVVVVDSDQEGDLRVEIDQPHWAWVIAERAGSGNGDCTVMGQGKGTAVRSGSGNGSVWRLGAGMGDSRRCGSGNGEAGRRGLGMGDAVRQGYGDGDAMRLGRGAGDARREGAGDGDAKRADDGPGDAVRSGSGDGDAKRSGSGRGNARRVGSGTGHAVRCDEGHGKATRLGRGEGAAVRCDEGHGDAIRGGYGHGEAWRQGEGDGDAVRMHLGSGNAVREGSGKGDAWHEGLGRGKPRHSSRGEGYAFSQRNRTRVSSEFAAVAYGGAPVDSREYEHPQPPLGLGDCVAFAVKIFNQECALGAIAPEAPAEDLAREYAEMVVRELLLPETAHAGDIAASSPSLLDYPVSDLYGPALWGAACEAVYDRVYSAVLAEAEGEGATVPGKEDFNSPCSMLTCRERIRALGEEDRDKIEEMYAASLHGDEDYRFDAEAESLARTWAKTVVDELDDEDLCLVYYWAEDLWDRGVEEYVSSTREGETLRSRMCEVLEDELAQYGAHVIVHHQERDHDWVPASGILSR